MSIYRGLSAASITERTTYARQGEYQGHRTWETRMKPRRPLWHDIVQFVWLLLFWASAFGLAFELAAFIHGGK